DFHVHIRHACSAETYRAGQRPTDLTRAFLRTKRQRQSLSSRLRTKEKNALLTCSDFESCPKSSLDSG
ncbi:hypothetical protein GCK32_016501, partial [Trichostrongylus colubriformis]